jgi:hypothetical protein
MPASMTATSRTEQADWGITRSYLLAGPTSSSGSAGGVPGVDCSLRPWTTCWKWITRFPAHAVAPTCPTTGSCSTVIATTSRRPKIDLGPMMPKAVFLKPSVNGQCDVSTGGCGGTRRWPSMSPLVAIEVPTPGARSGFSPPSPGELPPVGTPLAKIGDHLGHLWIQRSSP